MGAEVSKPRPGTKIEVIGAGLPRTGTSSFTVALETLLGGPVFHGGTQCAMSGDETHFKRSIEVFEHTPIKTPEDKKLILSHFRKELDGFIGVTDSPWFCYVPELLELYPNAKVICTTRDPKPWSKSMGQVGAPSQQYFISLILYWVPCARLFPIWGQKFIASRWGELYLKPGEPPFGEQVYPRHIEWLKRVVPKDQLVFYDVRDGWEPLCKALGKPVPNVPFPKVNDSQALDECFARFTKQGMMRWAAVIGAVGVTSVVAWRFWPFQPLGKSSSRVHL